MASVYGYATYSNIDDEINGLADLVPDGKNATIWVEGYISQAEKEVNARLSVKYGAPFTGTIPDIINYLTIELACYRLLRQCYVKDDPSNNDWVDEYRKNAERIFNSLIDGEADLNTGDIATSNDLALSSTSDEARVFTTTKYDSEGNVLSTGSLDGI